MRYFILVVFILSLTQAKSQSKSDCKNAVQVQGNSYNSNSIEGFGEIQEFSGNELGNLLYFAEEHHSIWLTFKAETDGDLTLDIKGKSNSEDWDFILFEADVSMCEEIQNKSIKPLRSNLARNNEKIGSITGLNVTSKDEYVGAGINPTMSKWVKVEKGQDFILVLDNSLGENEGFDLSIHISEENKEIDIEEDKMVDETGGFAFVDMTESADLENLVPVNFEIRMMGTEEPVECEAEIVGVQWEADSMKFVKTSDFTANIPNEKWFYINVKKDGYTFGTEKYKADYKYVDSVHVIYISPMQAGNRIVLKEIVFRENTTHMLPTSYNALKQLIDFMNEYPTAKIEVQGHVNAPGYDNEGKVKKFSLKRAEEIKGYLVDAGIDGRRIEVSGKGNEEMIYPNPKNYDQEKANRRVEIEILSF